MAELGIDVNGDHGRSGSRKRTALSRSRASAATKCDAATKISLLRVSQDNKNCEGQRTETLATIGSEQRSSWDCQYAAICRHAEAYAMINAMSVHGTCGREVALAWRPPCPVRRSAGWLRVASPDDCVCGQPAGAPRNRNQVV